MKEQTARGGRVGGRTAGSLHAFDVSGFPYPPIELPEVEGCAQVILHKAYYLAHTLST